MILVPRWNRVSCAGPLWRYFTCQKIFNSSRVDVDPPDVTFPWKTLFRDLLGDF